MQSTRARPKKGPSIQQRNWLVAWNGAGLPARRHDPGRARELRLPGRWIRIPTLGDELFSHASRSPTCSTPSSISRMWRRPSTAPAPTPPGAGTPTAMRRAAASTTSNATDTTCATCCQPRYDCPETVPCSAIGYGQRILSFVPSSSPPCSGMPHPESTPRRNSARPGVDFRCRIGESSPDVGWHSAANFNLNHGNRRLLWR